MGAKLTKVLGYVAIQRGSAEVLCDGDSCIIAGSEKLMKLYLNVFASRPESDYRISKARYGHVLKVIRLGGVYSFDRESFARFCPLAREDGFDTVDFTPEDRSKPDGPALPLMRVQWIPGS